MRVIFRGDGGDGAGDPGVGARAGDDGPGLEGGGVKLDPEDDGEA